MTIDSDQRTRLTTRREELTAQYLAPRAERPTTTARGRVIVAFDATDAAPLREAA